MDGQRRPSFEETIPVKRIRQASPAAGPSNTTIPVSAASTDEPSANCAHISHTSVINKQSSENQTNVNNPQLNIIGGQPRIPDIFTIPSAVTSFAGRKNELIRLAELLDQGKMVAICGLAGIGKSELAKQYSHNNNSKYKHLAWLEAETEDSLKQCLRDLAKILKIGVDMNTDIKRNVGNIFASLTESNQTAILIFDNALHRRAINAYLPSAKLKGIHVIITSQSTQWGSGVYPLELQPIHEEAAMEVFRCALPGDVIESNVVHLQQLAKHLSYMPLALQLVACYLRQEADGISINFSVDSYVQKLIKDNKLLDKNFTEDSEHEYQNSIYKSLAITLDRIKNTAEDADMVLHVLCICAYLNADRIDDYKLKPIPEEKRSSALRELKKYSLVSVEPKMGNSREPDQFIQVRMHRLVQQVLRFYQERCGIVARHLAAAVRVAMADISHLEFVSEYAKQHIDIARQCFQKSEIFQLAINDHGGSWLLVAARRADSQLMQLLVLDFGVSIHRQAEYGRTPLHLVAWCENECNALECTETLVQFGACVHAKDKHGRTSLHWAAKRGHSQLVRLFVEVHKCDLEGKDKTGSTPLHLATRCSDQDKAVECSRLLVHLGASVHAKDKRGRLPVYWARNSWWTNPRLARLLEEFKSGTPLSSKAHDTDTRQHH